MAEQRASAELFDLYGPAWTWKPPLPLGVTSSWRLMRISDSLALIFLAVKRPDASLLAALNTIRTSPAADATDKADAGCADADEAAGAGLACATFVGLAGAWEGVFCGGAVADTGWTGAGAAGSVLC